MRRQLIVLAERATRRSVSYCEHDMAHITWDQVTLHMRRHELLFLADLLEHAVLLDQELTVREAGIVFLREPSGATQLWLGQAALYLPPLDFVIFADMLGDAARMLMPAPLQCGAASLGDDYAVLQIDEDSIFARN
jgi:hypothetical protein